MNIVKKIREKYSSIPKPAKASIWFVVCSVLQNGISMLTIPIFTRLLTPEQFGVFTVYQSWYSVISIFATLNLSAGIFYNGMIKFENDRDRFMASMQGLSTTVTVALFLGYCMVSPEINNWIGLTGVLIVAMFAELLFVPAYSLWSARQRFDYQYKNLVAITLFLAIFSPIAGIYAVLSTKYKAEARVISFVAVQICIGCPIYIYNLYKGRCFFDRKYWKFALWFNVPLIPHYLSMSILNQSDRIMINQLVGGAEAAIYGVAYNISQLMVVITTAISNSFNPYTYKAIKEKKYGEIGANANLLLVLVGIGICLVVCFGPEAIKIIAPPDYYSARWIIPPVSLSVYFLFLYPLFSNVEFYFEKNKFVMLASVSGAVLNVLLNYIAIPMFGYVAAGYTTLICYVLFSVCHYVFYLKVLDEKIPGVRIYDMRFISIFTILLIIFIMILTWMYDFYVIRYLVGIVILCVLFVKRRTIMTSLSR